MGIVELVLIAIGLSMDAFAVSVCKGLASRKADFIKMFKCGIWFGGFQGLMPLIGFFLGRSSQEGRACSAVRPSSGWTARRL